MILHRSYHFAVSHVLICALAIVFGCLSAHAEVVVLRSGQSIRGEVVLHNDEVLVIRTEGGARYQYPATEVVSVEKEQEPVPSDTDGGEESPKSVSAKRVAIHAGVAGGAAYLPMVGWGGYGTADLLVGTHNLMQRRIFIGGGLGFHAVFAGSKRYAFIPVQVAAQVPFLSARHSPVMGMAVGYGFSVNSNVTGGIYTGLDVGWKYCFSDKASLAMSANIQWQQTSLSVTEEVDGQTYSRNIGTNLLMIGAKCSVQF